MIASVMTVIIYFEIEKENKGPLLDVENILQRTDVACGTYLRTVQQKFWK